MGGTNRDASGVIGIKGDGDVGIVPLEWAAVVVWRRATDFQVSRASFTFNANGQCRMAGREFPHCRNTTVPSRQKSGKVPQLILKAFRDGHLVPMRLAVFHDLRPPTGRLEELDERMAVAKNLGGEPCKQPVAKIQRPLCQVDVIGHFRKNLFEFKAFDQRVQLAKCRFDLIN